MGRGKKIIGKCHVCGNEGELTFEHVAPQKAFNNLRTVRVKFDDWIELGPDATPNGPIEQGGIGKHTLCGKCNNDTGSWYGEHFILWCYQGMNLLERSGGNPKLYYLNYLRPLPILKQICTMFASVNPPEFFEKNIELRKFVLNRERKFLPDELRIYAYYCLSNNFRYAGLTGVSNPFKGETKLLSEISYPPFGYLLTLKSLQPDERLLDITPFASYNYDQFVVGEIRMNVLPTITPYPGDYRNIDEIKQEGDIKPEQAILGHDKSMSIGRTIPPRPSDNHR